MIVIDKYAKNIKIENNCNHIELTSDTSGDFNNYIQNITIGQGIHGKYNTSLRLKVERDASPVVYEAANTKHIILD